MTNLDHSINARPAPRGPTGSLLALNAAPGTSPNAGATSPSVFDMLLDEQRAVGRGRPDRQRSDQQRPEPTVTRRERGEASRDSSSVARSDVPDARARESSDESSRAGRHGQRQAAGRRDVGDKNDSPTRANGDRAGNIDAAPSNNIGNSDKRLDDAVEPEAVGEEEAVIDPNAVAVAGAVMLSAAAETVEVAQLIEAEKSLVDVTEIDVSSTDEATSQTSDTGPSAGMVPNTDLDLEVVPLQATADDGRIDEPGDGSGLDDVVEVAVRPTSGENAEATEPTTTADGADAVDEDRESNESGSDSMLEIEPAAGTEPSSSGGEAASDTNEGQGQPGSDLTPEPLVVDTAGAPEPADASAASSTTTGVRSDGVTGAQQLRATEAAAATASPTTPQATAFDGEVWEQVQKAVNLVRQNGPGRHEVSLVLRPDDLGSVSVELIQRGDEVAVRIITQTPAAQDRLDRARLLAELQSAGIDPSSVDISHHDPGGSDRGSGEAGSGGSSPHDSAAVPTPTGVGPLRRSSPATGTSGGGIDLAL